jgi:hypothetical protein
MAMPWSSRPTTTRRFDVTVISFSPLDEALPFDVFGKQRRLPYEASQYFSFVSQRRCFFVRHLYRALCVAFTISVEFLILVLARNRRDFAAATVIA